LNFLVKIMASWPWYFITHVEFLLTLPAPSGTPPHEVLALDCEMVI